jgi:hypothetical protein
MRGLLFQFVAIVELQERSDEHDRGYGEGAIEEPLGRGNENAGVDKPASVLTAQDL